MIGNFQDKFRQVGENVAKVRTDVMQEQLATFRSQLEEFARKHKVIRWSCVLVACVKWRGNFAHSTPTKLALSFYLKYLLEYGNNDITLGDSHNHKWNGYFCQS